jgi:proline dehydrogenase
MRSPLRSLLLAAANSGLLKRLATEHGLRFGAARFVAGNSLDEAVPVLARLNGRGLLTNTTLLGEGVLDRKATRDVVATYREVLQRIKTEGLKTNLAVKLTQLGLELDETIAYRNLRELVNCAEAHNNFIRIDMEESRYVDPTLRIYRRLRDAGHANVGVVLQSCLYRSNDDLVSLLPYKPNVRIVKGAYLEPSEVAFQRKSKVDAAYLGLARLSLQHCGFTALATHDQQLIEQVIDFAGNNNITNEHFQFQMLYGVRPRLQLELVARGHSVLVATPYGPDWYRYLMRRLAERPANLFFILRNALRR